MVALPSTYQPNDGTILEWRIYPPGWTYHASPSPTPTPAPGPGVIVEHGGNWNAGDPFQPDIERVCQILAQSGFWVFSPSYRLAPCGRITHQPPHGGNTLTGNPSGRPPQQTDDLMFAMLAARNSTQCTGHKVGILGSSVGGFLAAYVALYRHNISGTGRPQWHGGGDDSQDYRPDCIATFSSPFDISDQETDDPTLFAVYIGSLQNYVGNCSLTDARNASPISLINGSDTAQNFKPMFIVQADDDDTNPHRQLDNITIALNDAGVDACDYPVKHVTTRTQGHAIILWPQPDPNPDSGHEGDSIGDSALRFSHDHLDN